jgi:hypothetical protein
MPDELEPTAQQGQVPVHGPIHLPGPSFTPIAVSAGVAITLFGLVPDSRLWRLVLISIGFMIVLIAGMVWAREAMREYADLPE